MDNPDQTMQIFNTVKKAQDQLIDTLNTIPLDVLKVFYLVVWATPIDTPALVHMRAFQLEILAAYIKAKEFATHYMLDKADQN